MTREQLSRKGSLRGTGEEYKVRKREILRLAATGLYNCTQIGEAYNRSPRLIGRIRAENIEPVNPWMTYGECAEFLGVSLSVIAELIDKMYIETYAFEPEDSPGATLNGSPVRLAVRKSSLLKHKDRWGSAADACSIAGITRKGMEARARKGQAATIEAFGGKTFAVNGQAGLRYIYDLTQIIPAVSEPKEKQLEMHLEPKSKGTEKKSNRGSAIRVAYKSDLKRDKETVLCDRELDLTMHYTKEKCSKRTDIRFGWDVEKGQPIIDIKTRVPVTVRMSAR